MHETYENSRGSLNEMKSAWRALALVPLALVTVGCTPIVTLQPAKDAINPICASVIVSLRNLDTIADLPSRETDAQGTAAWGSPAAVILHCGVPVPAPTATLPCVTVDGVDWLRDDSGAPNYVFTTYGRDPAIEVVVNDEEASALSALTDLANVIVQVPATGKCLAPEVAETG